MGPNSSLRVYRSKDQGETFRLQAIIPAPSDRDIRDPAFYTVGNRLYIKAITRLPGFSLRDTGVDSISVETHSTDAEILVPDPRDAPPSPGSWRGLWGVAGRSPPRQRLGVGILTWCCWLPPTEELDRRLISGVSADTPGSRPS